MGDCMPCPYEKTFSLDFQSTDCFSCNEDYSIFLKSDFKMQKLKLLCKMYASNSTVEYGTGLTMIIALLISIIFIFLSCCGVIILIRRRGANSIL